MASITTNGAVFAPQSSSDQASSSHTVRRVVSPEAARALKMLGHAIEYLANEFLQDSIPPTQDNARLQAVRLLMALNREIYFECPMQAVTLSFRERCRAIFRMRRI
jgi:hypothetical protein